MNMNPDAGKNVKKAKHFKVASKDNKVAPISISQLTNYLGAPPPQLVSIRDSESLEKTNDNIPAT